MHDFNGTFKPIVFPTVLVRQIGQRLRQRIEVVRCNLAVFFGNDTGRALGKIDDETAGSQLISHLRD